MRESMRNGASYVTSSQGEVGRGEGGKREDEGEESLCVPLWVNISCQDFWLLICSGTKVGTLSKVLNLGQVNRLRG